MARACVVLCALALALTGCTSTQVQGDVAGDTASGATGERAQELEQALVKRWNLSRTERDGYTVFDDDDVRGSFTLKEDGSATISGTAGGARGRWEASTFDDITFFEEQDRSDTKRYTAFPVTYDPDANELLIDAGVCGAEGTLCFADGIQSMSKRATYPSADDLIDIRDASALFGDWELFWVRDGGTVAEGEADKLAKWMLCESGTLTLKEGGQGTFLGDEVEWWMGEGFATMTVVEGSGNRESFDIGQLPGSIVVTGADDDNEDVWYQFARPK